MNEKPYEIRDPIHGLVQYSDIEREVINSPVFQRLRRIRQLAWTDYVYPGATHNRFEHSIGVMHVAGRIYDALLRDQRSKEIISSEYKLNNEDIARQRQIVRLAALTHDLGHGPFSHAAESLFPRDSQDNNRRISHEEYSSCIIRGEIADILGMHKSANALAFDAEEIASYIDGTPKDRKVALFKAIISGTIDSDRMDYLLRDAYHCGVRYGQYDIERIINTLGVCEDDEDEGEFQVGINIDGIHAAEGLVIARFMMFTQVYLHKTRMIYDYHFENCMEEILSSTGGNFPNARETKGRKEFLAWDDWRVLGSLANGGGGKHGELIRNRNHYRRIYETKETFSNELDHEKALKKFEKMKEKTKHLGCIALNAEKTWYKQSLGSDILVRPSEGSKIKAQQLSNLSSVVKSLIPVNQRRLYVPSENADSARKIIESN